VVIFDSVPSELSQIYWRYTLNDIKVKLRLYVGHTQASIVQDFQTMAIIVSQAFGGGKKKEVYEPKTKADLELAFGSVFGG